MGRSILPVLIAYVVRARRNARRFGVFWFGKAVRSSCLMLRTCRRLPVRLPVLMDGEPAISGLVVERTPAGDSLADSGLLLWSGTWRRFG